MKVYGISPAGRDIYRAMREKNIRREAARLAFVGLIRGGIIGGRVESA